MKRILFLFLIAIGFTSTKGQDLTPAQIRLRTEISSFLREEGFMPEIDSDGDIKFKKEGIVYFVMVNEKDTSPMFVILLCQYSYPEGYSKDIVKLASTELNFYKGIKVLCYDSSIHYQAEMYLKEAETFKAVFYKLIGQLESVRKDMYDECEKFNKAKIIINRVE